MKNAEPFTQILVPNVVKHTEIDGHKIEMTKSPLLHLKTKVDSNEANPSRLERTKHAFSY